LTESYGAFSYAYKYRESLITAISAGFFLILVGALFVLTPRLFNRVIDFFNDFDVFVRVPNTILYLPAPTRPGIHSVIYTAVEQFAFVIGVFQIVILALRFAARSPVSRKAETVGNLVFWIGLGYLTRTLLLQPTRWGAVPTLTTWFVFWAAVFMLGGVTLIIRAIILAATIPRRLM